MVRDEMRDAGVTDYQTTIFGAALHGFTDPHSEPANLEGMQYDELCNVLSWNGILVLLHHLFSA